MFFCFSFCCICMFLYIKVLLKTFQICAKYCPKSLDCIYYCCYFAKFSRLTKWRVKRAEFSLNFVIAWYLMRVEKSCKKSWKNFEKSFAVQKKAVPLHSLSGLNETPAVLLALLSMTILDIIPYRQSSTTCCCYNSTHKL